jgi:hypothetical protein
MYTMGYWEHWNLYYSVRMHSVPSIGVATPSRTQLEPASNGQNAARWADMDPFVAFLHPTCSTWVVPSPPNLCRASLYW